MEKAYKIRHIPTGKYLSNSELSYTDLPSELEEEYSKIIDIKSSWKMAVLFLLVL